MTTIKPRTGTVDIYQGDYLDRIRHIEQQHDAAVRSEAKTTRLLADIPESHRLAEEHAALVAEASEDLLTVTVTALGRKVWRALIAAHPPREDNDGDEAMGVNEETFKEALIYGGEILVKGSLVEYSSIVSPDLSEEDLENLSDIDFDRLYYMAFALNRSPAAAPKVLTPPASRESLTSDSN